MNCMRVYLHLFFIIFLLYAFNYEVFAESYIAVPVDSLVENIMPLGSEWKHAPIAIEFSDGASKWKYSSSMQTSFQIMHDRKNLIFKIEAKNNTILTPTAKRGLSRDNSEIFSGECIELFIENSVEKNKLYQFVFAPDGAIYDSCNGDAAWNASNIQITPFVSGREWGLQVSIPMSELGIIYPFNGNKQKLKFNIGRTWIDDQKIAHISSWTPLKNNGYHSPECFTELILAEHSMIGLADTKIRAKYDEFLVNGSLDKHIISSSIPDFWQIPAEVKYEYGEKTRLSTDFCVQLQRDNPGVLIEQKIGTQVAGLDKFLLSCTLKRLGNSAACFDLVFLDENGTEMRIRQSIGEAIPIGEWKKYKFIVTRPANAVVLKSMGLTLVSGKDMVMVDDFSVSDESETGSLQLGSLQPLPELSGSVEPLCPQGFIFGTPVAKSLRILAFIDDAQPIGDRILADFAYQSGIEIDIIKNNSTYEPELIKKRFTQRQYDAFFFIGRRSWNLLKENKNPLIDAIINGTGALFLGAYDGHGGIGEIVWKNGDRNPRNSMLNGVPLCEMSPSGADFIQFGIHSISKGAFGKGRCVEIITRGPLFYRHGIWPAVDEAILADNGSKVDEILNFDWWNYYNSLYAKCFQWIAQRTTGNEIVFQPSFQLNPGDEMVMALTTNNKCTGVTGCLYRDDKIAVELPLLRPVNETVRWNLPVRLSGGRYFLNVKLLDVNGKVMSWSTAVLQVIPKDCPALTGLTVFPSTIKQETPITVSTTFVQAIPAGLSIESVITDAFGREIYRQETQAAPGTDKISFKIVPDIKMVLGRYARLDIIVKRHAIEIDRRSRDLFFEIDRSYILKDYVLAADLWIPLHYRPAAENIFRKIGINTINCWIPGSRQAATAGFNWTDGWGGVIRNAGTIRPPLQEKGIHGSKLLHSTDDKHLRNGCLSDPQWQLALSDMSNRYVELVKHNPPLGYMLCDEMNLAAPWSGYHDPMSEPCHSIYCMNRYRNYLKGKYGTVEALNRIWKTNYNNFSEIIPPLTGEARNSKNYAPWIEFRIFMDDVFSSAGGAFSSAIGRNDMMIKSGQPNWTWLTPFSGIDPVKICANRSGSQDYGPSEMIRCFKHSAATVWSWNGYAGVYNKGADSFGSVIWKSLMHGATGSIMYMTFQKNTNALEGFVHPLIGETERSKVLCQVFTPILDGLGRLIINTTRRQADFAILYSQPSMYVSWMLSKDEVPFSWAIRKRKNVDAYNNWFRSQEEWEKLIHAMFWQFDYLDEARLAENLKNYKVLVLPMALAVSNKTKSEIIKWQLDGGIVVADINAGLFNEIGAPDGSGWMSKVFGVIPQSQPVYDYASIVFPVTNSKQTIISDLPQGSPLKLMPGSLAKASYLGGMPSLVVCRRDKGWGLYLNCVGTNKSDLRNALVAIFADEMKLPRPFVAVNAGEKHESENIELIAFEEKNDSNLYLAAIGSCDQKIELQLPKNYFVYDMLDNQFTGYLATLRFKLKNGIKIWALQQEKAENLTLRSPLKIKRGKILDVESALHMNKPGKRIFHLKLKAPDGKYLIAYQRNLDASGGRAEFSLPIALNAIVGKYEIELKDVACGLVTKTEFYVE